MNVFPPWIPVDSFSARPLVQKWCGRENLSLQRPRRSKRRACAPAPRHRPARVFNAEITLDEAPAPSLYGFARSRVSLHYEGSSTSIVIPERVTSISRDAFLGCFSLAAITVETNNPAYSSLAGVLFDRNRTTILAYPPDKPDTDYAAPNGVTSIGNRAFFWCRRLTSLTIGNRVSNLGVEVSANIILNDIYT